MRRVSSRMTFFYKRVFPVFWFGFLVLFICIPFLAGPVKGSPNPPISFLLMPVFMMVVGYFFMKKLVFDLVDEVWEDGDALVVRNRGEEERVVFRDVKNVNYSSYVNPPRVTLSLRRSTVFGDQITFGAPIRFIPFSTSPVIDELIDRIDAARQKKT
jgi:hypothetical protein